MKYSFTLAALASVASAHYQLDALSVGGVTSAPYTDVRAYTNDFTNAPVTSVTSLDIQCNVGASTPVAGSSKITNVAAGSQISVMASQNIYHPGPGLVYLAKVPAGYTAATWTPSGNVWFKIGQVGVKSFTNPVSWVTDNAPSLSATIPKNTPSGNYLIRFEQIGLHVTGSPQFYLSCGQINVTGGGSGTPSPLVAFPGAYSMSDPALSVNIWNGFTSYTPPGPAVWTG